MVGDACRCCHRFRKLCRYDRRQVGPVIGSRSTDRLRLSVIPKNASISKDQGAYPKKGREIECGDADKIAACHAVPYQYPHQDHERKHTDTGSSTCDQQRIGRRICQCFTIVCDTPTAAAAVIQRRLDLGTATSTKHRIKILSARSFPQASWSGHPQTRYGRVCRSMLLWQK